MPVSVELSPCGNRCSAASLAMQSKGGVDMLREHLARADVAGDWGFTVRATHHVSGGRRVVTNRLGDDESSLVMTVLPKGNGTAGIRGELWAKDGEDAKAAYEKLSAYENELYKGASTSSASDDSMDVEYAIKLLKAVASLETVWYGNEQVYVEGLCKRLGLENSFVGNVRSSLKIAATDELISRCGFGYKVSQKGSDLVREAGELLDEPVQLPPKEKDIVDVLADGRQRLLQLAELGVKLQEKRDRRAALQQEIEERMAAHDALVEEEKQMLNGVDDTALRLLLGA